MKTKIILLTLFICGFTPIIKAQQILDTTFQSGSLTLNGTLTLPAGNDTYPIVVLAHGSGANDRNESFTPTGSNGACLYPDMVNETSMLFKDLADSFALAGIATFRYDKRTYTHATTLDPQTILVNDFADDLSAAVDFIKGFSAVDQEQIYLLGHSQGSNFIAVVAQQRNDINGLISMGGNTTPIDTILARQNRDISYLCNQDTATGDQYYSDVLTAMGMVRDGSWPNNQALLGAYEPFWKNWIDLTDSVIFNYNAANLPLLVLQGGDDFNVPPSEAQPFYSLDPATTVIVELSGLNHFFNDGDDPETTIATKTTIIEWILGVQTSVGSLGETPDLTWKQWPNLFEISSATTTDFNFQLFDIQGRKVMEQTTKNSQQMQVNYSNLNGIYIAVVKTTDGQMLNQKCFIAQ